MRALLACLCLLLPFAAARAETGEAARALIAERAHAPVPLVLVTHQVNITALSGVFPASGEIIVMRLDGDTLSLAGRIRTD